MSIKNLVILVSLLVLSNCNPPEGNLSPRKITYQEEMQNLVGSISENAKAVKKDFLIIPQNGIELLKIGNNPSTNYLKAIDAMAIESLFYGYEAIDQPNSTTTQTYFNNFINGSVIGSKPVFVIDYVYSTNSINNSIAKSGAYNYKLFNSPTKKLNEFPQISTPLLVENKNNIATVEEPKNFMALLDLGVFSKDSIIKNLSQTNFDLIVIEGFYQNQLFTSEDIKALKVKKNGGRRLVLAELDVSMANSKRYYWLPDYKLTLPGFVNKEIGIDGNFRTNYWDIEWQNILSGSGNSITNNFIKLGFDGVYLTGVEAFEWYE
ncbi:MAG: hypothetical protein V4683_13600 [Bacteroidota bacterium]